jgi:hypothetical protein
MHRGLLAAAVAVSMVTVSSAAVAQSAAPLTLAGAVRAGPDGRDASDLRGGFIIPTLIVLAIIGGIYLLTKDGDPASP